MQERGQGVARDTRRAAQVYVRAAQLGCTQSAQRLEELLHSEAHPYGSALTHGCVQAVRASPKVTNSKASGAMAAEGASTGGRTQKDSPGGGMMPGGSGPSVRFALGETAERVLGGKAGALAHVH